MPIPIRIAVAKGRIMGHVMELWGRIGSGAALEYQASRRLIIPSSDGRFEFLPVKGQDVGTYVQAGVAHAGVVGLDMLLEHRPEVEQALDLRFAACRLVVAAAEGSTYPCLPDGRTPRVATRYLALAQQFFTSRGEKVELVPLSGSVEIAPLLGMADWVVELVETGRTLRENGLEPVDTVAFCTARLVVNSGNGGWPPSARERLIKALERVLPPAPSPPLPVFPSAR